MTYEVGFVLAMGGAALLRFLIELIHRKNIVNRRDAILSWSWFLSYFIITSVMVVSKWTQKWPYILVVAGYGLIGLVIYYIRKKYISTNTQNPKPTKRSLDE